MISDIGHLVIGPVTHGVVRCAISVRNALKDIGEKHPMARLDNPDADIPTDVQQCGLVHIHVTDRLFGRNPAAAAHALRATVRRLDRPVSVTLHDIPQPSDGPAMRARIEFYREAAACAVGVVVSSGHEATLLAEHVDANLKPEIVPLMIERHPVARPAPTAERTVGVLGFLYPGKGHIETLDALRDLPPTVGFVALGTPSPGHEDLVDELHAAAAGSGRACEVTGFLDDAELRARAARVTVPVAYHRHMSASGSVNSWIAVGRRPLVPRTPYTQELDARSPGMVQLHDNDDRALRTAIAHAVANPSSTWLDTSTVPSPSPADVALAYSELLRRWSR